MRMFFVSSALLGLIGAAVAGEAASSPEAAASGAAAQVAATPKTVCRRELPTGSTIPRTMCHTEMPGDEAQRAQTQHELADEAQRNRMMTVHSGG